MYDILSHGKLRGRYTWHFDAQFQLITAGMKVQLPVFVIPRVRPGTLDIASLWHLHMGEPSHTRTVCHDKVMHKTVPYNTTRHDTTQIRADQYDTIPPY